MRRNRIIVSLAFCFALGTVGALTAADLPGTDPGEFWTYITRQNDYTQWKFFPGKEGIYPGQSPHGAYLKVYVNDIAYEAAKEGRPMPEGAIIVKENYGKDQKTLMAVTPMYKVKGYNPEGGDWFWGKYGPDGKVMAAGKVDGCIRCHSVHKTKDWRFLHAK
ncbi:Cytochrome P460 [Desulfacinum infernum DSM 9756]|uniref:Cytochrome P460 n=1 Tax=Desulfacinum infernum DSM 9756 TaxID=1121391 RepID=A0A1M4TEH6_9BACT|nr:cytochrome P460 family protein [Desulfacinum infernum]SHE42687.1 Cytochrome P460 [Desulfacinum infernum DSM 9756]